MKSTWSITKSLFARLFRRFFPRVIILHRSKAAYKRLPTLEIAERAYYLRLQVVEYNGNFIKEFRVRNCWSSPEDAEAWMNGMILVMRDLMRNQGVGLEIESCTKFADTEENAR